MYSIHHIALPVQNIIDAVDYYTEFLDARVEYQDTSWALIRLENISLALVLPDQHPPHLAIERSDAEKFGHLTRHRDGTSSVYITDPWDNVIEVLAIQEDKNLEVVKGDDKITEVFYDGSCPVCSIEIQHYRKVDCANRLKFTDISCADPPLPPGLSREQALKRFYVLKSSGKLVSGASAFIGIWECLPRWRIIAGIARFKPITLLLEVFYRFSLFARPVLSRAIKRLRA